MFLCLVILTSSFTGLGFWACLLCSPCYFLVPCLAWDWIESILISISVTDQNEYNQSLSIFKRVFMEISFGFLFYHLLEIITELIL
jgi:hypothetical protein